jgi:hypothetical protein
MKGTDVYDTFEPPAHADPQVRFDSQSYLLIEPAKGDSKGGSF